ncbi:MAG: heparan-alpha-glucosaminide N-acetyltransferase domain-containing protein [Bacteroidota bacterium]
MKKRIIGIDVARALAVIGMIIVNFKIVIGQEGASWLEALAGVFNGKAAATFVVLAGVGMALLTNSAIQREDQQKLVQHRNRILKRAAFYLSRALPISQFGLQIFCIFMGCTWWSACYFSGHHQAGYGEELPSWC